LEQKNRTFWRHFDIFKSYLIKVHTPSILLVTAIEHCSDYNKALLMTGRKKEEERCLLISFSLPSHILLTIFSHSSHIFEYQSKEIYIASGEE
jgi:hypothetical protein